MATWYKMLINKMENNKDSLDNVESATPPIDSKKFNKEFNSGYGVEEGCPFVVYTKDYIYFPACYDGAEWIESIPRNPTGKPIKHVGG